MAVFLSPVGGAAAQFFDNNGAPLTGGKLYTYAAGTSTPVATYTSSSGLAAHTNPIILNSAGRIPSGEIWLAADTAYKFVIKTSADVLIGTYNNIFGLGADTPAIVNATGNGSQTLFALNANPANENSTNVFINGVYQQKNTYSISGTSLIFSEAPPINATIEVSFT